MTYYGFSIVLTLKFSCGCTKKQGPILEKFAYQYARLGAKQKCKKHGGHEVDRVVTKIDGPHGWVELGFWRRENGTWIFLTWTPATGSVDLWDGVVNPDNLINIGSFTDIRNLVHISDDDTIWRVVGSGPRADHLGGKWTHERAEAILARLEDAASTAKPKHHDDASGP